MRSISTNSDFEIVVITAEGSVSDEATTCNHLLEVGLSKLHVRKPHASAVQLKKFIQAIGLKYRRQIIVHEHHELVREMNLGGYHIKSNGEVPMEVLDKHVSKSFHAFEEIQSFDLNLRYGFLSPVFDSLSKPGYASQFTMQALKEFLSSPLRFPLYALGGITINNISIAKSMGFKGAAVLGSIWQEDSEVKRLKRFEELRKHV